MSDLLEQLYFGELSPFESWAKKKDEETMWFRQQLLRGEEQLRALLDEEADQRFQAYQELEAEARVRHYLKNFTLGFRLGMGLALEASPSPTRNSGQ